MNTDHKKMNPIWNYFTMINKDGAQYVKCNVDQCESELKYNNSPKPLMCHVYAYHPHIAKDFQILKDNTEQQQQLIDNEQYKVKPLTELQKIKISISISKFIYTDLKTLNTVESQGFINLLRVLEPRYNIPPRTTFRETYLPDLYSSMKQIIKQEISEQQGICITTDYWTNKSMKAFITMTVHFIDHKFKFKNYVLKTYQLDEKHTADNTRNYIENTINEYCEFKNLLLFGITTDSAPNMVKARRILSNVTFHISCFSHCLHNSILMTLDIFGDTISKVRQIVKSFRMSSNLTQQLHEMQKRLQQPNHKLIIDSVTRWSSSHQMLERFLENKQSLINISIQNPKLIENLTKLTNNEWELLQSIVEVLQLFKDITLYTQKEETPIISMLLPFISNIKAFLSKILPNEQQEISKFKQQLLLEFDKRSQQYDEFNIELSLCCLLDPRFKNLDFMIEEKKLQIHQYLMEVLQLYKVKQQEKQNLLEMTTTLNELDLENSHNNLEAKYLASILGEIYDITPPVVQKSEELLKQFKQYLNIKPISLLSDPLDWWNIHQIDFPLISLVARHYLSFQISSSPVERQFSQLGILYANRRNQLSAKTADILLFLNYNNKKINKN